VKSDSKNMPKKLEGKPQPQEAKKKIKIEEAPKMEIPKI
jgi:hypothetical protein